MGVAILFGFLMLDLFLNVFRTWRRHRMRHRRQAIQDDDEEDEFTKSERFELSNIFKYDLEDFGLWGNSFGYILTFTILIFMYYNKPTWIKPTQSGALVGLEITIVFLFLASLIILMMRIIPDKKKEEVSFSEKIASLTGKHETQILIDRQKKVRWAVLHFG